MPDYSELESLADVGGAEAVPDNTPFITKAPGHRTAKHGPEANDRTPSKEQINMDSTGLTVVDGTVFAYDVSAPTVYVTIAGPDNRTTGTPMVLAMDREYLLALGHALTDLDAQEAAR